MSTGIGIPPTPAEAQQANANTITNPATFAAALCDALGVPANQANIQAIVAWQAYEGQWTARGSWNAANNHNPLNIEAGGQTQNAGGGNNISMFASWQDGVDATANFIQQHTPQIIDAMRNSTTAQGVANAIDNSGWAASYASGAIVKALGGVGQGNAIPVSAAGSGSGVGNSAGAGGTGIAAPPFSPEGNYEVGSQVQTWVMQNAPQDAWMLSNPELAKILGYAAQYSVTDTNEINGLVSQTNWYKTHSADQRAWVQLYASDPQEAQREIQQSKADITAEAGSMGVALTPDQLNTLAINKKYYAWDPTETQYAISSYLPSNKAPTAGGAAEVNFQSMKATATQTWGVPTSDAQIAQWTAQIAAGTQTVDGVTALLKQQATSLYPTLADQFNRGFTFAEATDPYKQIAQQYLGTPADQINFTDPKWMAAVNQVDPKTGQRTEMGLDQWTNYIRSQPQYGYQNTNQAKNEMVGLSNAAAKTLGVIA